MNQTTRRELPSAEAYVGLPVSPEIEQQPLSEQMGAYELERLFGNTYSEITCVTLGAYGKQPKIPEEAYRELQEAGAFELEPLTLSYFSKKTKDFTPEMFIEGSVRSEDGEQSRAYALTPFGMTVRGAAGQLLRLGLRTGMPLEDMLGKRRLLPQEKILSAKRDPIFGQVSRLFVLLLAGNPENSGVSQYGLYTSLVKHLGIRYDLLVNHINSLADANLVKIHKEGCRGKRIINPAEKLTEIHGELGELVTALIKRDTDVVDEGNAIMDSLLSDGRLGYLVKRSFVDKNRFSASRATEEIALGILSDSGIPMTTRQLYAEAKRLGLFDGTYGSFAWMLKTAVRRFENPKIAVLGRRIKGKEIHWQLSQVSIATAARNYGRSLELK